MKDPDIIKILPDGHPLYDFDPADEYPDAEIVGVGMHVVQRKKGITPHTAEVKSEKRLSAIQTRSGYHEFVPCIRCTSCVVLRGMSNGEVKNLYYACQKMKMQVERYGTCIQASEGNGPLVIEKDLNLEEALANKSALIN